MKNKQPMGLPIQTSQKNVPPPLPTDTREKETRTFPKMDVKHALEIIKDECDPVSIKTYGNGNYTLIILPGAWEKLKSIIDWGEKTPSNVFEQIYQGMGPIFEQPNGKTLLVISHFLLQYTVERTPASAHTMDSLGNSTARFLEYERDIYAYNEPKYNTTPSGKRRNPFLKKGIRSELVIHGHTHPDIGAWFSPTDRNSSIATPNLPGAIFVADPIRKELKAAVGMEQKDATIYVCEYVDTGNKGLYEGDDCVDGMMSNESEGFFDAGGVSGDDGKVLSEETDMKYGEPKEKTKEELIVELGDICNNLLSSSDVKGTYFTKTTLTGKEHIRVDMMVGRKKIKSGRVHAKNTGRYPAKA